MQINKILITIILILFSFNVSKRIHLGQLVNIKTGKALATEIREKFVLHKQFQLKELHHLYKEKILDFLLLSDQVKI